MGPLPAAVVVLVTVALLSACGGGAPTKALADDILLRFAVRP